MADCDNCKYKTCWEYAEPCSSCTNMTGEPTNWKPQTNADRIRGMSDEELADWVAERCTAPNCTGKCHKDYEAYGELRTFCHDCWLDWLKQEAE